MAESIVVHFAGTEIGEVENIFIGFSEVIGNTWYVPLNKNYSIQIYFYKDYLEEYNHSEKLEITHHLGSEPNFSYCFEFKRSHQNKACETVKELFTVELANFNFVVDDCINKFWTKTEIQFQDDSFLKDYYYE